VTNGSCQINCLYHCHMKTSIANSRNVLYIEYTTDNRRKPKSCLSYSLCCDLRPKIWKTEERCSRLRVRACCYRVFLIRPFRRQRDRCRHFDWKVDGIYNFHPQQRNLKIDLYNPEHLKTHSAVPLLEQTNKNYIHYFWELYWGSYLWRRQTSKKKHRQLMPLTYLCTVNRKL
jgi:hypothetical protein